MQNSNEKNKEWLDLALKSKDLKKKVEYCTKYLELNPNDMDAWGYRGKILSLIGRHKEAIESHEKEAEFIEDPLYLLGEITEDFEEAVKSFNSVLEKDPENARAWVLKARALNNLGKYEEAIICFNQAEKLNLSKIYKATLWHEKGWAFSKLENLEEAVKCLDNSLAIDPGNPDVWATKGIFCIQDEIKRYREALICFNEALKINPINPSVETECIEDCIKTAKKKLREL